MRHHRVRRLAPDPERGAQPTAAEARSVGGASRARVAVAIGVLVCVWLGVRFVLLWDGARGALATAQLLDACATLAQRGAATCAGAFASAKNVDPWGRPFLCELGPSGPEVFTLGADGEPGGVGRRADLRCAARQSVGVDGRRACSCRVGAARASARAAPSTE